MNPTATEPTYSQGYLVGAVFALLITIALAMPLFVPSLRSKFRWGDSPGDDLPMSLFGQASWALAALAVAVILAAAGIHYSPVTSHIGWILTAAFSLVFIVGVTDSILNRKK